MKEVITINGVERDVRGAPLHQTMLDWLREDGMTGTKRGCDEGDCGACTLLVLDESGKAPRAINACLALVKSLVGQEIATVEGLKKDGTLHPCQQEMIENLGSQCGYCTPGIVCSMAEASARGMTDNQAALADQLCGNLCRCTGYRPIREAALATDHVPLPATNKSTTPESSKDFHRPTTLEEALALKAEIPDADYLAGATEWAVLMNKRGDRPRTFISLAYVEELLQITKTDEKWIIGAGAPLTDVEAAIAGEYRALDQMLRLFASRQIRHRATLGGNLVTASPIGDSAPVLLVLDATVVLAGLDGQRRVALNEFFTGYRETVLKDGELMVSIEIPRGIKGETSFSKVSKRREMDISTVACAARLTINGHGVIKEARLAYGGIAATPARAKNTENALLGRTIDEAKNPDLLGILENEFSPMSDQRGSSTYRQLLIRDLFLKHLAGDFDEIGKFTLTEFKTSEKSQPHESAKAHVTGAARYVEDDALSDGRALKVWPVRSTHARAKITKLDLSKVTSAKGVHTVLSAQDVPGANNSSHSRHDEPLFAEDEVFYHGQLLAVIIGDSLEACRLAEEKVIVEYEALQPLLGISSAIAADSYHTEPHILARGDVKKGLADSQLKLEGTLEIGGQEHFYLETHGASARPDDSGGVVIRSSTQHPSEIQTIVAEILGKSRHEVVVECPRMGGGFGGKETQGNGWAAICALAALQTGREVMVQLDRDDDMEWSGKRHPFFAKYEVGFESDGRLKAVKVKLVSDGGWSLDLSQPVCDRALFHLDNAYYIPHCLFEGRVAKTNVTSHTAFRGFGGPQGMIVIEEIMGRVAQHLALDPDAVRRINFYGNEGEQSLTHYGALVEGSRLERLWAELSKGAELEMRKAEIAEWNADHPHRKRGLAMTPVKFGISFTLKYYNQAGALVLVYSDGTVQVNHGGTEMGQGLYTKILGVAMRELGLPAESIRMMKTRTDKVPNTSATAASAGSDLNGMAVADACSQLKERLSPLAAGMLECAIEDVVFENGQVRGGPKSITFTELTEKAYQERIQLSAVGFYRTPDLEWDWNTESAEKIGKPFHYYSYGTALSEVEIDGFTGMHHVRRVDILHDVGDSLNPAIDRGQIEGAFVQAMGWLTAEELKWSEDDGRLLTHSASTYAIPAFSDAPMDFRISLLNDATQKSTIHGSKAVGEPPFMLAFSVREALRHAIEAFGKKPSPEEFPSPLTGEVLKKIIGPLPH